jgi:hypothetical protein
MAILSLNEVELLIEKLLGAAANAPIPTLVQLAVPVRPLGTESALIVII